MTRRPARFTQAELARAMRVALSCGMTVRVMDDGSFLLVPLEAVKEAPVDFKGEVRL